MLRPEGSYVENAFDDPETDGRTACPAALAPNDMTSTSADRQIPAELRPKNKPRFFRFSIQKKELRSQAGTSKLQHNQAQASALRHSFRARRNVQLREYRRQVKLHRVLGDAELPGDRLVGQAVAQH